jgi:hypothetical protein
MELVNESRILDRDQTVQGLSCLTKEWQIAAEGLPLTEVYAVVGLMLADVISAIGLLPEDAEMILGAGGILEPATNSDFTSATDC